MIKSAEELHNFIELELADKPTVWIPRSDLLSFVWGALDNQAAIEAKLTEFCDEHSYDHKYNAENHEFGFTRKQ